MSAFFPLDRTIGQIVWFTPVGECSKSWQSSHSSDSCRQTPSRQPQMLKFRVFALLGDKRWVPKTRSSE